MNMANEKLYEATQNIDEDILRKFKTFVKLDNKDNLAINQEQNKTTQEEYQKAEEIKKEILPVANKEMQVENLKEQSINNKSSVLPTINEDTINKIDNKVNDILPKNNQVNTKIENLNNNIKGMYNNNTITLNENRLDFQSYGHELNHHLAQSKGYEVYSDFVLTELDKTNQLNNIKNEIIDNYKPVYEQEGRVLTEEDVEQEVVSRYTEKLFKDEESINRLLKSNRNVFQKIYDWVVDKVKYYKNISTMTLEQRQEYDTLRKAQTLFRKALESESKPSIVNDLRTNIDIQNNNTDTNNSIKSNIIDKINLAKNIPQSTKNELIKGINNINEIDNDSYNTMISEINDIDEYYKENNKQNIPNNKTSNTKYDKAIIQNAVDIIPSNKQGKRTKQEWLKVAQQIGINVNDKTQLQQYAEKSWKELHPNISDNLNRQGQRYVKFTKEEWINAVKGSNNTKYSIESDKKSGSFSLPKEIQDLVFNDDFYDRFKYEDKSIINETIEDLQRQQELLKPNESDSDWDKNFDINQKIKALRNGYDNVYDYLIGREKQSIFEDYKYNPEKYERKLKEHKKNVEKQNKLQKEIEEATPFKREQYEIIQKTNPMFDDVHTGIRSPADIKTFKECIENAENDSSFEWGDYTLEDAQRDLKRNKVRIYSSYAIKNGVFVSTSYQQALDYAGGDRTKVHSREVNPNKVAWINGDEGQYAKVSDKKSGSFFMDNKGRKLSKEQQEYFKDSKLVDENGNLKNYYHGTQRADRVGNIFDPNKATSGPMAFFTDNEDIAKSYSKNKQDTSLSREYDTEYDLFKINNKTLDEYWDSLTKEQQDKINNEGYNIGLDEDFENIIYEKDASKHSFSSQYDYYLKNEENNNGIKALFDVFIQDGNLMFEDMKKFEDVLKYAGIKNVEYLDPYKVDSKVYNVYLNIKNPFNTSNISSEMIGKLEKASKTAKQGETYSADIWDKSNISPKQWIERFKDDIKNGTAHAWTSIPDWVTEVLKKNGYDGIIDTGGKNGGNEHQVVIPFYSNQIKNVDNTKPTSNFDIRYSLQKDQRKHYETVKNSPMVDKVGQNIANDLLKNERYIPLKNQKAIDAVEKDLINNGINRCYEAFKKKINSDERMTVNDIAMGERLIQELSKTGDYDTVSDLIQDVAILGTELGQQVQAMSLINKMTPTGQLHLLEKTIARLNNTIKGLKTDINISDETKKNILKAENKEQLDNEVSKAIIQISEQIPISMSDKLRSWRYLSMLGNPRTHIRNILANIAMKGTQGVKNKIAGAIEDIVNPIERTKTFKPANKETKAFAVQDANKVQSRLADGGHEDIMSKIKINKRNFDNKILNSISEFNSNMLEKEDWIFLKSAYKDAMANYMTANKLTADYLNSGSKEANIALEKAREYSINQAQEATFRQFSQLASDINRIENRNTLSKFIVGGIAPFKKTPINIAKAGFEYSPLSLLKATKEFAFDIKSGKKTVNQAIDTLSKGMTGTSIMAIGMLLASKGILKASGSDDKKEEKYLQSLGNQDYSVKIGDNTYTLDWLSPTAMPLFAGAELWNAIQRGEKINLMNLTESSLQVINPLMEMSMLQSFASALTSYNSDGTAGKLSDIGQNVAESYIGQFVPTALGQLAKTIDDTERDTSYTDKKGIEKELQQFSNRIISKIPIASKTLQPKTDIWGNDVKRSKNVLIRAGQNMIAPYYKKQIQTSTVDKEIQEVYKNTGESVLPVVPNSKFTINKKEYKLPPKDYTEYKKYYGNNVKSSLKAIVNTNEYQQLNDERKAKVIQSVYSDILSNSKENYSKKNKIPYTKSVNEQKIDDIVKEGLSLVNSYIYKSEISKIEGNKNQEGKTISGSSNINKVKYIMNMNTTNDQKNKLLSLISDTDTKITMADLNKLNGNYTVYIQQDGKKDAKGVSARDKYMMYIDAGIPVNTLNKYYNEIGSVEGIKNASGKTISGSKKQAVINYINSLSLNATQKKILLTKYNSSYGKNYQNEIFDYINNLNINKKRKEQIWNELFN